MVKKYSQKNKLEMKTTIITALEKQKPNTLLIKYSETIFGQRCRDELSVRKKDVPKSEIESINNIPTESQKKIHPLN